jgi:AcrR family transcriptional regulator
MTTEPRARNARGDLTRDRLLDAAERLFSARGVNAVSLREIRLAAGARNTAAMQFHFGDRDGVFLALAERHMPRIAEIQERLFQSAVDADALEEPRSLVAILMRPVAEYLGVGTSERRWVEIMGNLASLPDLHLREMISFTPEAGMRAGRLLHRRLMDDLPDRLALDRIIMMAQASLHLSSDHARLLEDPTTSRPHDTTAVFIDNLVDMLTAALLAPVTALDPHV